MAFALSIGNGGYQSCVKFTASPRSSAKTPSTLATLDRNVQSFLAARDRTQMRNGGEEALLNKLLNEMDGLREDAEVLFILTRNGGEEALLNKLLNEMDGLREDSEVLFILTTNRPEQIEPALMSRPGRIDQAIEFPLPDPEGRAMLIRLYARGLQIHADLLASTVHRTQGVSAAFIKVLLRRCAQCGSETSNGDRLTEGGVSAALEEMLFAGGTLNRRLLGGEQGPA